MSKIDTMPRGGFEHRPMHRMEKAVAGGSIGAATAGLAAVVLAILGMLGLMPLKIAAIAAIAVGAGLLFEGIAISMRFDDLRRELSSGGATTLRESRGGLTVELLGGLTAITLGILALLGVDRQSLLAIAVIVVGATLMLGAGVTARLAELETWDEGMEARAREVDREAARSAAGSQVFLGVGVLVLGILALVGIQPALTFILIAFLAAGASMLFSGALIGTRMSHLMH